MQISSRITTILLLVCFTIITSSAQFGIRAKYSSNEFSTWENALRDSPSSNTNEILNSSFGVGVDYWFRLKEKRIEFLPELSYGLKTTSSIDDNVSVSFQNFAFNFNTHIYAFDLVGDCDCPTFSKQGPTLKKGFFFLVSPGVSMNMHNYDTELPSETSNSATDYSIRFGVGAGYDIGINDLVTVTPIVSYNVGTSVTGDHLEFSQYFQQVDDLSSSWNHLLFQLRIGFRPDYVNKYRR